jgi:hypothetical protein
MLEGLHVAFGDTFPASRRRINSGGWDMSSDPLMQPFTLKHLVLRNRLMSTAHEPAYTEDGMPKARYRLYHAEKAKGGIALVNLLGYLLSKYNRLGVFIVIWFAGCLLFAVHRSNILPTSKYMPSECGLSRCPRLLDHAFPGGCDEQRPSQTARGKISDGLECQHSHPYSAALQIFAQPIVAVTWDNGISHHAHSGSSSERRLRQGAACVH